MLVIIRKALINLIIGNNKAINMAQITAISALRKLCAMVKIIIIIGN